MNYIHLLNSLNNLDKHILFIIIIVCLSIAFLVILTFLLYWFLGDLLYFRRIIQDSRITREYIVDIKNNVVTYFDRIDLKRKVVINLNEFYTRFHQNDIGKLKNWIHRILEKDVNIGDVLEIDVLKNHGRLILFSILRLISYDQTAGKIHLENTVLKNIMPNNVLDKRHLFLHWKKFCGLTSYDEMQEIINKGKSLNGYTFVVRFFNKHEIMKTDVKANRYIICGLKNEIFSFASGFRNNRYVVDINYSEIALFDLKISTKTKAIELVNEIVKKTKCYLQLYGYVNDVDTSIGIIQNSEYYQDYHGILEFGSLAALDAHSKNKDYILFERSHAIEYKIDDFEHEVDKLFKPNGFSVTFRPIINLSNASILGYFDYICSASGKLTNYQNMSRLAFKEGKNKKLFKHIANSIFTKFNSQHITESKKLFFLISLRDFEYLVSTLNETVSKNSLKLVIVFDETEIKDNAQSLNDFKKVLDEIKALDIEIAILLHDDNLLLNPNTYANFDYFIIGNKVIGEIKVNNQVRLSIHNLIEQLLKYKRPIIVTDLDSWQTIELLIKSGVTYVSSEVIINSAEIISPVDKKKIDKLEAMYDKYL